MTCNENCENQFKAHCQLKLMHFTDSENKMARSYPPTCLEWHAAKQCVSMAVDIYYIKNCKYIVLILKRKKKF